MGRWPQHRPLEGREVRPFVERRWHARSQFLLHPLPSVPRKVPPRSMACCQIRSQTIRRRLRTQPRTHIPCSLSFHRPFLSFPNPNFTFNCYRSRAPWRCQRPERPETPILSSKPGISSSFSQEVFLLLRYLYVRLSLFLSFSFKF